MMSSPAFSSNRSGSNRRCCLTKVAMRASPPLQRPAHARVNKRVSTAKGSQAQATLSRVQALYHTYDRRDAPRSLCCFRHLCRMLDVASAQSMGLKDIF
jgi:hypothetical protein